MCWITYLLFKISLTNINLFIVHAQMLSKPLSVNTCAEINLSPIPPKHSSTATFCTKIRYHRWTRFRPYCHRWPYYDLCTRFAPLCQIKKKKHTFAFENALNEIPKAVKDAREHSSSLTTSMTVSSCSLDGFLPLCVTFCYSYL